MISSTTLCFGFDGLSAFEEGTSSFSFPFEGFDGMFVTKSGIVVVAIDSSASSNTTWSLVYSARQSRMDTNQNSQSGLVSGFFLNEVGSSSSSSPSSPPKLRSFVSLPKIRRGTRIQNCWALTFWLLSFSELPRALFGLARERAAEHVSPLL